MSGTRQTEILIIALGFVAIIFTTLLTTQVTVKRLQHADAELNQANGQLM